MIECWIFINFVEFGQHRNFGCHSEIWLKFRNVVKIKHCDSFLWFGIQYYVGYSKDLEVIYGLEQPPYSLDNLQLSVYNLQVASIKPPIFVLLWKYLNISMTLNFLLISKMLQHSRATKKAQMMLVKYVHGGQGVKIWQKPIF